MEIPRIFNLFARPLKYYLSIKKYAEKLFNDRNKAGGYIAWLMDDLLPNSQFKDSIAVLGCYGIIFQIKEETHELFMQKAYQKGLPKCAIKENLIVFPWSLADHSSFSKENLINVIMWLIQMGFRMDIRLLESDDDEEEYFDEIHKWEEGKQNWIDTSDFFG